jgi:ribosomal protein L37E
MADLKPLKQSDVLRFLAAKNTTVKCDACGSNNFHVHNEITSNSRVGATAFKFPGYEVTGADVLDLVMIACENCGKVQFFARQPMAQWCEQHPSH